MDDNQPQKIPESPIPDVQMPQKHPEGAPKKPKILYIVLIVIVLLILILGALVGILLVRSNKESGSSDNNTESESSDQEEDGVNVKQEDQSNEDESSDEETNQDGSESQQEGDENTFDMTSLWPTYDNSTYEFKLKYPKDLIANEQNVDASTFEVAFKAGDLTAFTVWVKQGGQLDNNLQLMLANQCSQSVTMSNTTYGGYTYRKALDVPDEQCLTQLGVTRNTEFSSFGRDMGSSMFIMLRNDGLVTDQLEAVLGSIEYY